MQSRLEEADKQTPEKANTGYGWFRDGRGTNTNTVSNTGEIFQTL